MKKILTLAGIVFISLGTQAQSAESKLSESAIKDFYARSTTIHKESYDVYETFLENHFHDLLKAEFQMIHKIKGAPTQKQVLTLDKQQFMTHSRQDYETSRQMEVENKVLQVKMSEDGKEAYVKDSSFMYGKIKVPTPQGDVSMYVEIKALCADRVVLNMGTMQVLYSKCHIENDMTPLP